MDEIDKPMPREDRYLSQAAVKASEEAFGTAKVSKLPLSERLRQHVVELGGLPTHGNATIVNGQCELCCEAANVVQSVERPETTSPGASGVTAKKSPQPLESGKTGCTSLLKRLHPDSSFSDSEGYLNVHIGLLHDAARALEGAPHDTFCDSPDCVPTIQSLTPACATCELWNSYCPR